MLPDMDGEQPEQPEPNERLDESTPNGSPVRLLSYAEAAPHLGLSPDAVRMRCRRGRPVCADGPDGRGVVWPQPERSEHAGEPANGSRTNEEPNEQVSNGSVQVEAAREAAVLVERVARLEERAATAERDRDRWADEAAGLRTLLQQAQAMALAERDRADALEGRMVEMCLRRATWWTRRKVPL